MLFLAWIIVSIVVASALFSGAVMAVIFWSIVWACFTVALLFKFDNWLKDGDPRG